MLRKLTKILKFYETSQEHRLYQMPTKNSGTSSEYWYYQTPFLEKQ